MILAYLVRFDEAGIEQERATWPVADPHFLRDLYDYAHEWVLRSGGGQGHVVAEFSTKAPARLITHATQGNWGNAQLAAHLAGAP